MRNFRWLVVLVFAVLILGCGDDPIVNPDITPDENVPLPGRIAFASDRDGDFEIYMINADGTSLVRLTESKGVDYPSSWSPDGRKLAFVSNRSGSYNIYVMSVDGSEPTVQLTLDSEGTGSPNWSPDGRKLTFVTERRDSYNTYIISVGGSESPKIRKVPGHRVGHPMVEESLSVLRAMVMVRSMWWTLTVKILSD